MIDQILQIGSILFCLGSAEVLLSVDQSDPIVKGSLEAEGEGWRLADDDTQCKHSDIFLGSSYNCRERANTTKCIDENYQNRLMMLYYCRMECRDIYKDVQFDDLPESIQELGGLGDLLDTEFGFQIPVCSLREGWSMKKATRLMEFRWRGDYLENMVPKITKEGFYKDRIPADLFKDILEVRDKSIKDGRYRTEKDISGSNDRTVIVNDQLLESRIMMIPRYDMISMDRAVSEKIFKQLGPTAEAWSGLKLTPTSLYGIRRYKNNSLLTVHTDRTNTHVISVIMNIAQDVQEDWPLYIMNHEGQEHKIYLQPGDMVWYESARLRHGRPKPFKGSYFDNIFIHYKPKGKWYTDVDRQEKIPLKRVKLSQKRLPDTDWKLAWDTYVKHIQNSQYSDLPTWNGALSNDDGESDIPFAHIQ